MTQLGAGGNGTAGRVAWTSIVLNLLLLMVFALIGYIVQGNDARLEELKVRVNMVEKMQNERVMDDARLRALMTVICEQGCDTRTEMYNLRESLPHAGMIIRKDCRCPDVYRASLPLRGGGR
jgi:hypothetical protein